MTRENFCRTRCRAFQPDLTLKSTRRASSAAKIAMTCLVTSHFAAFLRKHPRPREPKNIFADCGRRRQQHQARTKYGHAIPAWCTKSSLQLHFVSHCCSSSGRHFQTATCSRPDSRRPSVHRLSQPLNAGFTRPTHFLTPSLRATAYSRRHVILPTEQCAMDIAYLALVIGFFGVTIGLALFCENLRRPK